MTDRERFEAWVAEKYFWLEIRCVEYMWQSWQEATKQAVSRNESAWLPVESMPKSGKFLIGVWEGDLWQPRRRFEVYEATGFKERPVWSASYRTAEGEVWEIVGWIPKPEATKQAKGGSDE